MDTKIKCIIIDDEPLAIKVVENHLKEFQTFEIVGTFSNPIEALSLIEKEKIEVIFLDINMSKMNGLEFLKNTSLKVEVVITTAYREFAVESFDLDVLDYLVKPIPFNRFLKTINKITQKIHLKKIEQKDIFDRESFIFLKADKKLIKVKFDTIFFIESLKDYIKVSTSTGNYLVHKSLTSITEELPKNQFLRIHRSFTIAIDKITFIEGNSVQINKKRIPIGRKYINNTKKVLLNID